MIIIMSTLKTFQPNLSLLVQFTFMTQLPPAMLKLDPKKLKESLRQLRQVFPVHYNRGDKMIKKLLWNISTLIKITCSVSY